MISEADKQRVANAIRAVETKTSGELFCVIARQSGDYRLIPLAFAAAIALLLPLPLIMFSSAPRATIYFAQLAAFVIFAFVLSLPYIRIHIIPRRARHDRAHAEAMRQFLAQGLDKTEQRTGVLIFASAAERYAEIVADSGINDKVAPKVWDDAVNALIAGIKADQPAEGFITAIEKCGAVLAQHFPPGSLNRDELPNKLVEI